MTIMDLMSIAFAIVTLLIGIIIGYVVRNVKLNNEINGAKENAVTIVDDAIQQADILKREALFEAKEENIKYRNELENEIRDRRSEVTRLEDRLVQREESLETLNKSLSHRENAIEKLENQFQDRENKHVQRTKELDNREQQIDQIIEQHQVELERVASLTKEDAREIILEDTERALEREIAVKIRDAEEQAKTHADRNAKNIVLSAIQRTSTDIVTDNAVSVIHLPNDDMKGRIIGREGRNIRTFESLTGIDLIIDDTPETVVLSGFDPIRRQIAKIALEKLIQDGRIHPARIEEMVERARKEVDEKIRETGEEAVFELGIHDLHPDLIKIIGRLAYRTSYGQNVLKHSVEVAKLTSYMASQLGEDANLAKRAGLLHDLGKAIDHEVEGTHVEIGTELAKRYHEDSVVVNSIASHHGDVSPTSTIAVLVAAADAFSAARPGARSESLENYVRRLETLEEIATSFDGVNYSFAIQAGREVRVMVNPKQISDETSAKLARDIKNRIENEMTYPGNIKVTVIRETRAIDVAK